MHIGQLPASICSGVSCQQHEAGPWTLQERWLQLSSHCHLSSTSSGAEGSLQWTCIMEGQLPAWGLAASCQPCPWGSALPPRNQNCSSNGRTWELLPSRSFNNNTVVGIRTKRLCHTCVQWLTSSVNQRGQEGFHGAERYNSPCRKGCPLFFPLQAASYLSTQGSRAYAFIMLSNKIASQVQSKLYLDFVFFLLKNPWEWWCW